MVLGEVLRRVKMLLQGKQFQHDLEDEMRLHKELREQQFAEAGMSAEEARSAANRKFGNSTALRETSYRAWGWGWLEGLLQDLRYGMRSMLRSPALTLVALLSLALGIGANTAIFSFLDAVLLRSIPVKDPARLVMLGGGQDSGITDDYGSTKLYSYPFYRQLQQKNAVFSDTASMMSMTNDVHGTVDGREDTEMMHVQLVSGSYFSTLGVEAMIGRMLSEEDDNSEGDHPVAVVSYAWWNRALASDPNVLSRRVKLGTTTFDIIGVAPPEFFGTMVGSAPDMWVPLSMMKSVPPGWDGYKDNFYRSMWVLGRLKPGVTEAQATSNVNLLYQQITSAIVPANTTPENLVKVHNAHVELKSLKTGISGLRGEFSDPLKVLMGLTSLVLLIACANIANLLLARSTVRARELAVRQALGARRVRVIRQLLTESLLLAFTGGALGLIFAAIGDKLLLRMISFDRDALSLDVSINTRLLLFSVAITVATAVIFGIIPALRGTRIDLTETLKDGRGGSKSTSRNPLGKALIVGQIAISLVLMVGAMVFVRSLQNLAKVETGFAQRGILRLEIDSNVTGIKPEDSRMIAMFPEIEQRVTTVPGVKAASFASFVFAQGSWNTYINVPGVPVNDQINIKHNVIGNDYFKTMQIPLLAGRPFGPQDMATSHRVAIISESMAKDLFPAGVNPIGHHYYQGKVPRESTPGKPGNDVEVVGIAKDVKFRSLQEPVQYIDYVPNSQHPWGYGWLSVRYEGDFDTISKGVQRAIHSVDRKLPISHITTMDAQVAGTITNQRLVAQLSAFFGFLAVFLSCIGIYGLMSYMVSKRTNEIGIRIAIGASRGNVRWLILREILLLVVLGAVLGVPAVFAGSGVVKSILFGLKGADTTSLLASVAVLLVVAGIAGYIPARRAAGIDPMLALRYE